MRNALIPGVVLIVLAVGQLLVANTSEIGVAVSTDEAHQLMGAATCYGNARTTHPICYCFNCQSGGCGCSTTPNVGDGNNKANYVTLVCSTSLCTSGETVVVAGTDCGS
jgi:hypothetical protein